MGLDDAVDDLADGALLLHIDRPGLVVHVSAADGGDAAGAADGALGEGAVLNHINDTLAEAADLAPVAAVGAAAGEADAGDSADVSVMGVDGTVLHVHVAELFQVAVGLHRELHAAEGAVADDHLTVDGELHLAGAGNGVAVQVQHGLPGQLHILDVGGENQILGQGDFAAQYQKIRGALIREGGDGQTADQHQRQKKCDCTFHNFFLLCNRLYFQAAAGQRPRRRLWRENRVYGFSGCEKAYSASSQLCQTFCTSSLSSNMSSIFCMFLASSGLESLI